MSPNHIPRGFGKRTGAALALALACLAVACTKHDAEFGSTGAFVPKDTAALDASLPQDTLRCATLNMSVGFPVSQLVFTDMADPVVAYTALSGLYNRFIRTRPKDRIKAMAHAIDSLKLDAVGLQEVLYFKRDGVLADDYLQELIDAIKADGGPAYQVFPIALNDTVLAGAKGDSAISIEFHEGNALLVHPGMTVVASDSLRYYNVFRLSAENPTKSERALKYVKLRSPKGVIWQVYTTHLEVFEDVSSNQAAEVVKFEQTHEDRKGGKTAAPQVILGDFNIDAGTGAHRILQDAGFSDTFDSARGDAGTTCCVAASALWAPDTVFSERRIDYIMARHWVKTVEHATALRGAFTADDGTRLLATDHRMLHAVLVAQ
jgi:endonuclease/exonuclease/phosphatase family metal-dependent hydrolase